MVERSLSFLVIAAATASAGCASVLGVDQNYVLGDEVNEGGNDGGVNDGQVTEGAAPARISCGVAACDPLSQECCLASDNTLSCASVHGNSCRAGVAIHCDQGAGCVGGVCCINLDAMDTFLGTSCLPSCPAAVSGSRWLALCEPDASTCDDSSCVAVAPIAPTPPFAPGSFYACQ
jgi:hypothetical protein